MDLELMLVTYLPIVAKVIGVFSFVASLTPNRADNALADILCRVINVLGMNFGNAKNEVK